MQSCRLAPPYSQIWVMDPGAPGDLPRITRSGSIWANSIAVAIGTLAEIDGETEIRLGPAREVDLGTAPAYVGPLDTPTGVVSVSTAEAKEVLRLEVKRRRVTVRIWSDRPREPTVVCIGVS